MTKGAATATQPDLAEPFFTPEAAQLLRRPFTPEAVKFKVQATWPQKDRDGKPVQPTAALVVTYINARLVVDRLNLVVPTAWQDEYDAVGDRRLRCKLTIGDLTRQDVGEGTSMKALYSDALKRAAVKYGVGVSLYATPRIVLKIEESPAPLKRIRGADNKASLALTSPGERRCRDLYARWLTDDGADHFGDALDHGDVAGAVGEADDPPPEQVDDEPEPAAPPARRDQVDYLLRGLALAGLFGSPLRTQLTRMTGSDPGPVNDPREAALALERLDEERADRLAQWVDMQVDTNGGDG